MCPHRIACFGLGPFLRFLVLSSSLLIPLLFFSPLCVSCPFLGALPEVSRPVSSSCGALSLLLSYFPVFRASTASSSATLPGSFSRSFLPRLLVIFRLCSVRSGSCSLRFLSHILWLSFSTLALSLSILVLLSVLFSDLFQFLFPSGCSLSYFQGFQFGS